VYALLLVLGPVLYVIAEIMSLPWATVTRVLLFSVLLQVLGFVGLILLGWNLLVGRWFAILALTAVACLADLWLGARGALSLLSIPVMLALFSVSFSAALVTVAAEMLLLILFLRVGVDFGRVGMALINILSTLGVMCAGNRRMHQAAQWTWEYFGHARRSLEKARKRQQELSQALEDLMHANRQLALAHERTTALRLIAEQAQRAKSEFAARVSHEFRAPLNMIIGLVGLMVQSPDLYAEELAPDLRQDLKIVHRNCLHLANMINDVLDLSRAEAGHMTLQREQVDLTEVIESATNVVRPLIEKKGLALEVVLCDDLSEVYCDRIRIRQVLLNLVSNAVRFTGQGGIKIQAKRQEHQVIVSVADTGSGISPNDADKIFEPFYQAEKRPVRDGEGSGLGLSICKQFIDLHGGQIWLASEPGMGTTFYFQLPILPPTEPASRPYRWLVDGWEWHERTGRSEQSYDGDRLDKPRIVLCDETGSLDPATVRFSDQVEFVSARGLSQAVQLLDQCPAHVVVLNAAVPDDLVSLAKAAREVIPGTPIVGCSVPHPEERLRASGALGYLVKPVTRAQLERAIRSVGRPVRRIMLVDDDPDVLQLWTRMLYACDSALEIVTASNSQRALDELHSKAPDLMLLDVILPDMSGWELLEQMQQDKRMKDIPVVFVSAQDVASRPQRTGFLLAAMGEGLSVHKLLRFSLGFSSLMFEPV
jgi:signal transduction histidine kinase/CheY-like chemotaxis protein